MQYPKNCILVANSLSTEICCISQTLDIEKNECRMKKAKKLLLYTFLNKIFKDNPGQNCWDTFES